MHRFASDQLIAALNGNILRTFVRVVELGGVTRAAESLHLAQSAVSAQLAILTRAAGGPLLERRRGRYVATERGREVYAAALDILARLDALEARLRSVAIEADAQVRLVCTSTVCDRMLARAVSLFRRNNADLHVVIESCPVREAVAQLRTARCDVVLIEGGLDEPGLSVLPFHRDRLRVAMRPSDPLAAAPEPLEFDRIADRPFVMQSRGSGTRRLLEERLGWRFNRLAVNFEFESNDAIISCVEEQLGLAFLSDGALAQPLATGTLVGREVAGVDLTREFSAVTRESDFGTNAASRFLEYLRNGYERDRLEPQRVAAAAQ